MASKPKSDAQQETFSVVVPLDLSRADDTKVHAELSSMEAGVRRALVRHLLFELLCSDRACIDRVIEAAKERKLERGEKRRGPKPKKARPIRETPVVKKEVISPTLPNERAKVAVINEPVNEVLQVGQLVSEQPAQVRVETGLLSCTSWE